MKSLRQWQVDCTTLALNKYLSNQYHFLCLATPGAGKSLMAAELAAKLFNDNHIDLVICFSPSIVISQGLESTFRKHLKSRFDGKIGALGASYTYQNLQYFDDEFWEVFDDNRVLVVFDEIHHCAGSSIENSNSWGEQILLNIQSKAAYTLALTGTPWRSNKSPICLSQYTSSNHQIECDYVYGLNQAIKDSVCRTPKIVLIDNDKISLQRGQSPSEDFSSIKDFLDNDFGSYQSVINDEKCIQYILKNSISKLNEIRQQKTDAAGLVVASSIEHATKIHAMLVNKFKKNATLVTHKHDDALGIINDFKQGDAEWIVSVGMISEGTDIPRLQVCCHLSNVKTELYFRQVLGRVLRINNGENQEAWLFTFAEPNLAQYAYRIDEELPYQDIVLKKQMATDSQPVCSEQSQQPVCSEQSQQPESIRGDADVPTLTAFDFDRFEANDEDSLNQLSQSFLRQTNECYFNTVGSFRQQLIEVFG